MLDIHIQILIGGLLTGGIYALIALGLTLAFGVTRILNVAHGDFLMLGSLVAYWVIYFTRTNPFLMIPILLLTFFAIGVTLYLGIIRSIVKKPPETMLISSIVVTLGLAFMIEDSASYLLSTRGMNFFSISYVLPPVEIGGIILPVTVRLISLIVIIAGSILLYLFIKRSLVGKMIRALIQNREVAISLGVRDTKISAITFGISIAFAAIAGLFMLMITSLSAYSGLELTIKALTIIILGGLGSFIGALIGALILGVTESYVGFYLGISWLPIISISVLIIVLLLRPRGLFGVE
ncbi:MAG: branched-chain amino acid ABC transporter permease [Nitrososphaerales archaeon]